METVAERSAGATARPARTVLLIAVLALLAGCGSTLAGQAITAGPASTRPTPVVTGPATSSPTSTATSRTTGAPSSSRPPVETGHGTSPAAPRQTAPTRVTATISTAPDAAELRRQHDAVLAHLLSTLRTALVTGDQRAFLLPFAPPLTRRVGHWFGNTRSLGVDAALFAPADDYSSGATDAATSFTRTVVLGIRTPYDDAGSMPGISYAVTVSVPAGHGAAPSITTWQPQYLGDPMNCDCTLLVTRDDRTAVLADASNADLVYWSPAVRNAAAGIGWAHAQLAGTGLVVPRGTVVFLADKPFHWFLSTSGPAQSSNVTAGLVDALGPYPGTEYSDQSRIVLLLEASDGSTVPNDAQGRQYAQDVLTHESTHQLMNRNSTLPERTSNSPPTWVVEGIAVAVETLHRDSLGDAGDIGYPEPNDPKNIDKQWFADHLGTQMPTPGQLYSSSGAGYYAISGSVFRYLAQKYGYVTMMKIADAMYSKPAQTPFDYFPDPAHAGDPLTAAAAKSAWHSWFVTNYE